MIEKRLLQTALAASLSLLLVLPAGPIFSADQTLTGSKVSKPVYTLEAATRSDKIVFKLAEGMGRPDLTTGRFERSGASWDRLNALLSLPNQSGSVRSHFSLDKSTLDEMRMEGSRRIGRQLPDLTLYYEIEISAELSGQDRLGLVNGLNALDIVEIAYFAPRPDIATIVGSQAATPAWESQQYYLQAAPTGIDAYYGWEMPGGHGENVKVIDIEGNWIQTHEDLHGGTDDFHIAGTRINDPAWWNHGTAVLGEIAADSNSFGVTGISYAVDLGTVSIGSMSVADAILTATANCVEGDIILIELHAPGPHYNFEVRSDQLGYVAMEYWPAEFEAIETSSALGRIVVEAAGNGAENYDDTAIYDSLFYPVFRFSGAVMVAASCSNHLPASFTNFGLRIDVHGYGCWDIYTLGYGDLYGSGPDDYYTSGFAGTSSASPIIVGACAILQGIHKNVHGFALDHAGMRTLLTGYSTPQATSYKRIGPMPDLAGSCDAVYGLSFTSDVTFGWVPLEVNFFGSSGMAVDSWTWDFGDGGSAYVQSPTYSYEQPGIFDVSLEINSGGEIYTRLRENYIIALADTMTASSASGAPGEQVEIVVTGENTVPTRYIRLPIEFPGDLYLNFDSSSTVGCRTEYFEIQDKLHYDPWGGRRLTLKLVSSLVGTSPDLAPGEGPIVKLYWTISGSATAGQTASVILDGYETLIETYLPEYQGPVLNYYVPVVSGSISVSIACCLHRGDLDRSGELDPLDAVYFADWLWRSGPGPQCEEEADVNGSGGVDPVDAVYIVNYFWRSGNPPVPCD